MIIHLLNFYKLVRHPVRDEDLILARIHRVVGHGHEELPAHVRDLNLEHHWIKLRPLFNIFRRYLSLLLFDVFVGIFHGSIVINDGIDVARQVNLRIRVVITVTGALVLLEFLDRQGSRLVALYLLLELAMVVLVRVFIASSRLGEALHTSSHIIQDGCEHAGNWSQSQDLLLVLFIVCFVNCWDQADVK